MDSENGNSCSSGMKTPTLKSSSSSASPMQLARQNFILGGQFPQQYHHSNLHTLDPYASSDSRSGSPSPISPFVQFLRSSSSSSGSGCGGGWGSGSGSSGSGGGGYLSPMPLTSIENFEMQFSRSPTVFKTPVKVEEDVLVMDGILVRSETSRKLKGSRGQRIRSPLSSFGGRLSSPSSSSSGKENRSFYKMEKCRAWEEFGTCRFGSRCQFSHAMEELHAKNFLGHSKPEELICKTISSGSFTEGNKSRLDMHKATFYSYVIEPSPAARVESVEVGSVSPTEPESTSNNVNAARAESVEVGYVPPIEPESTSSNVKAARVEAVEVGSVSPIEPESTTNNVNRNNNWCPLDDGIQVTLPSAPSDPTPSREAVNASIDSVVHGPSARKRLSAFTEFCSM